LLFFFNVLWICEDPNTCRPKCTFPHMNFFDFVYFSENIGVFKKLKNSSHFRNSGPQSKCPNLIDHHHIISKKNFFPLEVFKFPKFREFFFSKIFLHILKESKDQTSFQKYLQNISFEIEQKISEFESSLQKVILESVFRGIFPP